MSTATAKIRLRQRLGKFRIESRLGEGGFASVFQAMDTVMGNRVALKIPHECISGSDLLNSFRREARLVESVDHPGILKIKDASIIDDMLVIVFPLGVETLADRMTRRMSFELIISIASQLLQAVSFAHSRKVIHCDIKPENVIMFDGGRVCLGDFGIAKAARQSMRAAGTGTVGYMAPEQAMGRPSYSSDVFSLGLLFHRLLSGEWPEWPFHWPMAGHTKLTNKLEPRMIAWLKKSLEVNPQDRFLNATQMKNSFNKFRASALSHAEQQRAARRRRNADTAGPRCRTRKAA